MMLRMVLLIMMVVSVIMLMVMMLFQMSLHLLKAHAATMNAFLSYIQTAAMNQQSLWNRFSRLVPGKDRFHLRQ